MNLELLLVGLEAGERLHAQDLLDEQDRVAGRPRHSTRGVSIWCTQLHTAVLAPKSLILLP